MCLLELSENCRRCGGTWCSLQVFVCLLELSEVWWNMVFTASICVSSRTVGGVVEHGVHCKYLCVELSEVLWNMVFTASICVSSRTV